MKINWIATSGRPEEGARRWLRELPRITAGNDVVVWIVGGGDPGPIEGSPRVRPVDPRDVPWVEWNAADASVYHLEGPSAACGSLWRLSQRHSGAVVLHAPSFFDLFARLARGDALDREALESHVAATHGAASRAELARWLDGGSEEPGELRQRLPCTELATRGALGVLLAHGASELSLPRVSAPVRRAGDDPATWPHALAELLGEAERFRPRAVADRVAAFVATELGTWSGHAPSRAESGDDARVGALLEPLRTARDALEEQGQRLLDELVRDPRSGERR